MLRSTRESTRFVLSRRNDGQVEIGATRFGGLPDLPADAPLPEYEGRRLGFVAQIRLDELAEAPGAAALPPAGLLSFWYEGTGRNWGFSPSDRGSACIQYFAPSVELTRRQVPFGLPPLPICTATASSELTLPPVGASTSLPFDRLGLSEKERAAYFDLLDLLRPHSEAVHRMGGHPDQIQGDMQLQCQLVTTGLHVGDALGYKDSRVTKLRDGAGDWRLLLQIDSDEELGVMWTDAGRIYFWIREEDLKAHRFEDAWLIFQCR